MKGCLACSAAFAGEGWTCPSCGKSPDIWEEIPLFAPELATENEGFAPEYFADLARFEEGHFWFQGRNELIVSTIRKFFPEARDVLEVGCGTGFVLKELQRSFPSMRLNGSEIFREGLEFARKRVPQASFYQMDARRIPFEGEFDLVCALDVLEHIEEDGQVLSEIHRSLKPGGGLLVTVPQHRWLWSAVDEASFHKRRYSRRMLLQRVKKAGFKPVRLTSFVTLLLPLMMASRLKKKKQETLDRTAEFTLSPKLNASLLKVMRFEHSMIRKGVSFTAGGSLLLAARKE